MGLTVWVLGCSEGVASGALFEDSDEDDEDEMEAAMDAALGDT